MTTKTSSAFQGHDWISERWAAALAYDAIDKIHDLYLYHSEAENTEQACSIHALISSQVDMLYQGLTHLASEAIPPSKLIPSFKLGWLHFEARQMARKLSMLLELLPHDKEHKNTGKIITLCLKLKDHIRHIDQ